MVPKTVPYKNVKASSLATQARLRGDIKTGDESVGAAAANRPRSTSQLATNGTSITDDGNATLVNGDSSLLHASTEAPVISTHAAGEDPSEQLEMEMRQAQGAVNRDGDVHMTG